MVRHCACAIASKLMRRRALRITVVVVACYAMMSLPMPLCTRVYHVSMYTHGVDGFAYHANPRVNAILRVVWYPYTKAMEACGFVFDPTPTHFDRAEPLLEWLLESVPVWLDYGRRPANHIWLAVAPSPKIRPCKESVSVRPTTSGLGVRGEFRGHILNSQPREPN